MGMSVVDYNFMAIVSTVKQTWINTDERIENTASETDWDNQ